MVLAAGFGTRLRPLTTHLPKPLLPVCGTPVIAQALDALRGVGCENMAINLHHQGEAIVQQLGDFWHGAELRYFREDPILGTLGALRPMREWLQTADLVVVINGDSLCRWPLAALLRRHRRSGAAVTLLLSGFADPAAHGGGVGFDSTGRVVQLRGEGPPGARADAPSERGVFAGAQVFAPSLLERALSGPAPEDIVEMLHLPLLREGERLQVSTSRRPWWDLGTPERYLQGALGWAASRPDRSAWVRVARRIALRRRFVARSARTAAAGRIRRAMIEAGASVGRRTVIEDSLVLQRAAIGDGCHLRGCVVAPGVSIPAGSRIDHQMVTTLQSGRDPAGRDSVIGQLVFTPLGGSARRAEPEAPA